MPTLSDWITIASTVLTSLLTATGTIMYMIHKFGVLEGKFDGLAKRMDALENSVLYLSKRVDKLYRRR